MSTEAEKSRIVHPVTGHESKERNHEPKEHEPKEIEGVSFCRYSYRFARIRGFPATEPFRRKKEASFFAVRCQSDR